MTVRALTCCMTLRSSGDGLSVLARRNIFPFLCALIGMVKEKNLSIPMCINRNGKKVTGEQDVSDNWKSELSGLYDRHDSILGDFDVKHNNKCLQRKTQMESEPDVNGSVSSNAVITSEELDTILQKAKQKVSWFQ